MTEEQTPFDKLVNNLSKLGYNVTFTEEEAKAVAAKALKTKKPKSND